MVIRARNVRPSTASQCPEHTNASNEFWQAGPRPIDQAVKQEDEQETWPGAYGDEDLEDGSFGVAVANRRGDGRKPFDRVAVVLILDDLVVM